MVPACWNEKVVKFIYRYTIFWKFGLWGALWVFMIKLRSSELFFKFSIDHNYVVYELYNIKSV